MATHEEILEKLQQTLDDPQNRENWYKKRGPKDQLINEVDTELMETAKRELAELYQEQDPNVYSQKAFDMMEKYKAAPALGSAICSTLLAKGDQGKAVAIDVGKRVMSAEMDRYSPGAAGFIRSQHAINGLSRTFIEETSPGLQQTVTRGVDEMAKRYQTNGLLDQVSQGKDWQAKTELTSQLGKEMVALMSSAPLSEEGAGFLKEMRDVIEKDQGFAAKFRVKKPGATDEEVRLAQEDMADVVVNNNTALRFVGPTIQANVQCQNNQLWKDAASSAISTFSGARKDAIKPKQRNATGQEAGGEMAQEDVAANKYLSDISKNIHEARDMVLEAHNQIKAGKTEVPLAKGHLNKAQYDTSKFDRATQLENGKIKAGQAKLPPMEKRLADLNKPISIEKIKAFFSSKGVAGTKAEVKGQIEGVKKEIDKSREQIKELGNQKDETIHRSEKQEFSRKTGLDPDKLETALQIPAMNKAMMDFAKKEFNSENLEFMEAVKQFKAQVESGASVEELRKSAGKIKATFLENPDGGFEGSLDAEVSKTINLSGDVRDNLDNAFDKLMQSSPTGQNFQTWGPEVRKEMSQMFDESNTQVMKMTEADTFKRFAQSSSYKDAVKESLQPPKQSVRGSTGIDPSKKIKTEGPKVATVGMR